MFKPFTLILGRIWHRRTLTKKGIFTIFFQGIGSSITGMRLTFRHLMQSRKRRNIQNIQSNQYFDLKTGMSTLTYPYETIPVPDHGRYQLHNEIEDCIVCDKCAKICPVDCIDIEPIKSATEFGKTSDGTPKRIYAAKFDIDMAKCCFCGLCTTVCPTECLTMTPEYDFSVFDLGKMNFGFGNMTEVEASQKRSEWETAQAEKLAAKAKTEAETKTVESEPKPAEGGFRPRMAPRPAALKTEESSQITDETAPPKSELPENPTPPKPFRPRPMISKPKPPEDAG